MIPRTIAKHKVTTIQAELFAGFPLPLEEVFFREDLELARVRREGVFRSLSPFVPATVAYLTAELRNF